MNCIYSLFNNFMSCSSTNVQWKTSANCETVPLYLFKYAHFLLASK